MARYKNKWEELPPPPINPKRWGFDRQKGWRHQVSPAFKKAYDAEVLSTEVPDTLLLIFSEEGGR